MPDNIHGVEQRMVKALLGVPVLLLLCWAALKVSGFCYQARTFVSDLELMRAALEARRRYVAPGEIAYASADDMVARNPGCRSVQRNANPDSEVPSILSSALGLRVHTVRTVYRVRRGMVPTPTTTAPR